MKLHVLILLTGFMLLMACKKSNDSPEPSGSGNNNATEISPVPAIFTQKVLIEQFTGAWNGGCPDGIYRMDQLISSNSNKVIGVTIHIGDAMEIPLFNTTIAVFNNNNLPQFPSGMVNRIPSLGNVILSKTQWASNVSVNLSHVAKCGLAIKSVASGNTAQVEIHTGFNQTLSGNFNLTVYLVEREITGSGSGFDQVNTNTSNDPNSPYYNLPSPIVGFMHNHVVRKVLTADLGQPLNAANLVQGGEEIFTFSLDLTGRNQANLDLVAFINKTGTTAVTHEIMNVQVCPINGIKDWD